MRLCTVEVNHPDFNVLLNIYYIFCLKSIIPTAQFSMITRGWVRPSEVSLDRLLLSDTVNRQSHRLH